MVEYYIAMNMDCCYMQQVDDAHEYEHNVNQKQPVSKSTYTIPFMWHSNRQT